MERPGYQVLVPDRWRVEVDDDPSAEDQVNLAIGDGTAVGASISRGAGATPTRRRELERASAHAREVANVISVGNSFRLDEEVDGVEARAFDATYESGLRGRPPSTVRTIWFFHDDNWYVVSFHAPASSFDDDVEQMNDLIRSWEFT